MPLNFFETRAEAKPKRAVVKGVRVSRELPTSIDYVRMRERGCDGCPLLTDDVLTPGMKPSGDKQPDIYVLGEAPGADEDRDGQQFIGRSGRLLRDALEDAGLVSLRFDNCCRCRPPKNRTPTREEWERCKNRVVRSIERARPKVLLAVGATALEWALGESGITKWRGKLIPIRVGEHECWLYPILHPAFVLRGGGSNFGGESQDWGLVFRCDLTWLASRINAGLPEARPESLDRLFDGVRCVKDVHDLARLARQLERWEEARAVVAFDIETSCLRPYSHLPPSDAWLSIAFSDGNTTWSLGTGHKHAGWLPDNVGQVWSIVKRFLRSRCLKIAHALPFELEWLTSIFGHDPIWRRVGWGDTMSQSYILDERRGGLSLDDCCLHRFGFRLKEQSGVDRANLASLDLERLLKYNALDAKYEARLFHIQAAELEREGLLDTYNMHIRRCFTLVRAQQRGLVIDASLVSKFQKRLEKEIAFCRSEIAECEEATLYERKIGKPLSPTSPPQVTVLFRDLLKRPEGIRRDNKTGYSVDDAALSAMDVPIAEYILQLRTLLKQKSTYVDVCAPGGLVCVDGRLHTKFNDVFTVTGRLSSDSPNMQNFPKRNDAWLRAMITTPKTDPVTSESCEHVMVSADYGQIEPRVIAMASKDKQLCRALFDRYDIHGAWAERIASVDSKAYKAHDSDMKKLRQDVKSNWVLAGFYGASWGSIAKRLGLSGKCEALFDDFKEEFAGVWRWQRHQLSFYEQNGYVIGLSGRRRHAPLSINQVLNNVTQGTASDIVVDSMNRLSVRSDREREPAFQAVLNIHDDLTFYVRKDKLDVLVPEIVREMLSPPFDWVNVPLSVEVSIGPNWADLTPIGTFFSDELP